MKKKNIPGGQPAEPEEREKNEKMRDLTGSGRSDSAKYRYTDDAGPDSKIRRNPDLLDEPSAEAIYGHPSEKRQGEYTLEDYYALPDDQRVELIDGVIYDMAAPTSAHQRILAILTAMFETFVSGNKGSCQVFMAPCDVQLDRDDRTMVQPDLMVICNRDQILMRGISGAPDLVIEILSPSTRGKDTTIKTAKYCSAGVREYWVIDPDREIVLVYLFESSHFPVYYTFGDTVPVSIWDGELKIDFSEIRGKIAYLYDQ